jgi:hypothetical protein
VLQRIEMDYTKLSENDQKKYHTELCISEAHASMLNLLYCFARGKFYQDIKKQHQDGFDDYIINKLNLSPRQVQRYIKLYFLIMSYKRLLVSRKPFSDIVYFASDIEKAAANDPHVKSLLCGIVYELKTVDDQLVDLEPFLSRMQI